MNDKASRMILCGIATWLTNCLPLLPVHAADVGVPSPPVAGKHIRLLAIGNSFSRNATHYLPDIVKTAGGQLTFRDIYIGGCPLEKHWKNAAAFQQGSTTTNAKAWQVLTAESWDYITLQQYSMDSYQVETYRPYAKLLHDYIKAQAPHAEILIHETWAYREDDPLFKHKFTQQDMYWKLRKAYETIAGELGCRIIPSGDAFENARRDVAWKGLFPDPLFDYQHPQQPHLPDQTHSLNRGYSWTQGKDGQWKLSLDGHHANAAGEYLAAAVWFEFLYGQNIIGNSFVPKELKTDDVATLQRIAHQTVTEGLRPKQPTP